MTQGRTVRQRALAQLLRGSRLSRQDALVTQLKALGHEVTQATVSRDLEQLGAVKLRRSGETFYALPEFPTDAAPEAKLRKLFADWVRTIVPAASLVVLKTPPGSAHLLGVALDSVDLAPIAGTISGDDTLFVACRSTEEAAALAAQWLEWIND